MYESETLIVIGLTAAATIILAAIAIIQSNALRTQTDIIKSQFEYGHRAWVGMSSKGFEGKDPLTLWFHYKNYGNTVALNVKERWNFYKTEPTRDSIQNDYTHLLEKSINLPTQERGFPLTVEQEIKTDAMRGNIPLYAWVLLDYEHSKDQEAQYGVITKFDPKDGTVQVVDEWAT